MNKKGERKMQVTIDKEILGILDLLKIPENDLEITINVLLIKGLDIFVISKDFKKNEELKAKIMTEILKLKLKYIAKMLGTVANND